MVKSWHPEPTKRVVYNQETGCYLDAKGRWTDDEDKAKDFPSVFQALEFCCQNQITDAELVFKFGDGDCEVSIPIEDYPPEHKPSNHALQVQELSLD